MANRVEEGSELSQRFDHEVIHDLTLAHRE